MAGARAKTFADRLPPVVAEQEEDISALPDEMADLLYPGRRPRPFRVTLAFDAFAGPDYPRARDLARGADVHSEMPSPAGVRHEAAFETSHARDLRALFAIVGPLPGTEVRVDGKLVPYARELWLPLMWLFVRESDV
jgi:hypothetical protein